MTRPGILVFALAALCGCYDVEPPSSEGLTLLEDGLRRFEDGLLDRHAGLEIPIAPLLPGKWTFVCQPNGAPAILMDGYQPPIDAIEFGDGLSVAVDEDGSAVVTVARASECEQRPMPTPTSPYQDTWRLMQDACEEWCGDSRAGRIDLGHRYGCRCYEYGREVQP